MKPVTLTLYLLSAVLQLSVFVSTKSSKNTTLFKFSLNLHDFIKRNKRGKSVNLDIQCCWDSSRVRMYIEFHIFILIYHLLMRGRNDALEHNLIFINLTRCFTLLQADLWVFHLEIKDDKTSTF